MSMMDYRIIVLLYCFNFFFFNDTATTEIYTLSLHDALPISKDANEPKSMNTHLHIIEPYTNLYRVWPDARLAQQIEGLLRVFIDHITDPQSGHFHLFFDHDWSLRSRSEERRVGKECRSRWSAYE